MSTLERAIAIAAEAHAGQVDKAGEPYILHPLRVMQAMSTAVGRIVAVLHDVVEDCPSWSLRALAEQGFDPQVIEAVDHLTRVEGLHYAAYIDDIIRLAPRLAQAVKIADLRDNLRVERMGRLPHDEQLRLEGKYRAALQRLHECPDAWGF